MINSIIELPNFHDPVPDNTAAVCLDYMSFETGNNEWCSGLDVILSESRNLAIPPNIHKYKIEVTPDESGARWYFIVIATAPLNMNSENGLIFPVYARRPDGRVIMNVDCINDLFEYFRMASPKEAIRSISTIQFVSNLANACGSYAFNDGDMPSFTFMDRDERLIEIINQIGFDGNTEDPVSYYRNEYTVRFASVPREIIYIFSLRNMTMLQPFVNQYAMLANSELINAAGGDKSKWPDIYKSLHDGDCMFIRATDNILPHTPEDKSYMGSFLSEIYKTAGDDFWIDVRMDPRDVSDLYYNSINTHAGFKKSFMRRNRWADLTFAAMYAMDLSGKFSNRALTMHRTCMDEVVVYDKTNLSNPLLYLDMVWWTLCSAPGLINESNSMFF